MPLSSIDNAKDIQQTYLPLLLAVITFHDGAVLRLATKPLNVAEGGVQYGGANYFGRIEEQDIGAIQGFFEGGIDIVPTVRLTIADADKFVYSNYEQTKGFAGARLDLTFIFHDIVTGTFSSDEALKFRGTCDPAQVEEDRIYVSAVSKLNLQRKYLPPIPLQRRCPWIFPTTAGQRQDAADDEDSIFFECGYSPDASGGNARGNGLFTSCAYTKEACIERGMYVMDSASRVTGRFGGIQWDPPAGSRSRDYVSGDWIDVRNNPNEAKYGQPIPMVYGTAWVDAVAVHVIGDGNSTRGEAIICLGKVEHILRVVVNDVELQPATDVTGGVNYIVADALLRYNVINQGDRNGSPNLDTQYNGGGDPYGSMATILWVVPRRVSDSGSTPRIRVLVRGPQIRVYSGVGSFTKVYTENPIWVLMDLLIWAGLTYADLDIQTFIDAATFAAVNINYTDQYGNTGSHPRFACSLVLSQRQSAADVIRKVRQGCGAVLVPNQDGLLAVFIKGTLAQQQPAPVTGSNYNTPVGSGYLAYEFGKVLRKNGRSTLRMIPAPLASTPNRVNFTFANAERDWSADSLSIADTDAIARAGGEVATQLDVGGISTLDQGKRIGNRFLAEQLRGNGRGDKGGTDIFEFDYSFGVVRVRAGHICRISDSHHALTDVMIRLLQIRPSTDFREARIVAARHNDTWYSDTFGQEGDPETTTHFRNRLERPAYPWGPLGAQPDVQDPMFPPSEWNFRLGEQHEALADGTSITKLVLTGRQPVNLFSTLEPPLVGRQGTTASSGGSILGGGWSYYVAVCAVDTDGLLTAPSILCEIVVTVAGSNHTITIPVLQWPTGTTGYKVFAGNTPNRLTFQVESSGTPSSITLTEYRERDYGIPDVEFDRLRVKVKRIAHSGVWGQEADAVGEGTLTVLEAGWTADEWVDRDVSVLGIFPGVDLPILNFRVTGNTDDTLTVTPDPEALGVKAKDVIVMRSLPTVGSDGGGNYLDDALWQNTLENDGNGLAADEEIGRLVRIITGPGRGQVRRIKSNTATRIYIEGEWDVTPTAASRYIVEEPNSVVEQTTESLGNADPASEISIPVEVSNYERQTLLVKAYTLDGGGNESFDPFTPEREIYVFGRLGAIVSTERITYNMPGEVFLADGLDPEDGILFGVITVPPGQIAEVYEVWADVSDAPSGAAIEADLIRSEDDGASWIGTILASDLVIPAGETHSLKVEFAGDPLILYRSNRLRLAVTQIGSGNPGSGLVVNVRYRLRVDPAAEAIEEGGALGGQVESFNGGGGSMPFFLA